MYDKDNLSPATPVFAHWVKEQDGCGSTDGGSTSAQWHEFSSTIVEMQLSVQTTSNRIVPRW